MNKNLLKAKMVANNDSVEELAETLGVTKITLYSRLNGNSQFSCKDVGIMKRRYNLTAEELDHIFFD